MHFSNQSGKYRKILKNNDKRAPRIKCDTPTVRFWSDFGHFRGSRVFMDYHTIHL